ncbi:lipocalin family protein [Flavobacteriaceae bacterium GSB9]|nr:lipocalin family protein [Flavobacteriaceae bacterium GSB9]
MKKLPLLFTLLIAIMTSCSSDDSTSEITADIVGTWEMTDYDYTGTTKTTFEGQTYSADYVGEAFNIDYRMTFNENPNTIETEGSFSLELTTTAFGETSTQVVNTDDVETINAGTWEIQNGNLVTQADGGIEATYKIEELTETSLVLSLNQEVDISQSGVTAKTTINAKMFFQRQ